MIRMLLEFLFMEQHMKEFHFRCRQTETNLELNAIRVNRDPIRHTVLK